MMRVVLTAVVLVLFLLPSTGAAQAYNPVPGPSPYGPDDQAGASNTQGPEKVKEAQKLIKKGIVLQLGHVYEEGMPQFPGTHPWLFSLKEPQFFSEHQVGNNGILEGPIEIDQLGTQFDALGHFGGAPNYYLDNVPGLGVTLAAPGLGLEAAIWLSEKKIGLIGSDNWGIDVLPNWNAPAGMIAPVHHHFLAKSGIPMQESMHLQELAEAEVYEFAYIYSPLPIKGATGSPGIPLAVY